MKLIINPNLHQIFVIVKNNSFKILRHNLRKYYQFFNLICNKFKTIIFTDNPSNILKLYNI